ncbi:MAG: hypothetical protein JRE13_16710 [Deltaproteobacteria bacterium]|nr:hypothetical protein [Deltaproteobacteria bacterium]
MAWNDSASDRYPSDLLELGTPLTGTIWLEGMSEPASVSGTISITHTWMEESEADLALRRIDFSSTGSGLSVYLSDRTAPSGKRERWLAIARDGGLPFQTADFRLGLDEPPTQERGQYPTPGELRISGPGIEGVIRNETTLAEIDPLAQIPQPFRFLLSFKLRPHRVWARASFEIKLLPEQGTPETVLKGSGITTVTFTNPLPPKVTQIGN